MLPLGAVFAFVGRQLGRILTLAFNWATIVLFGQVPKDRQIYLSGMAAASLAWPIVLIGIAFPSVATFMIGFFTVPDWLHPWVRVALVALAVLLPLVVGFLSSRIPDASARPRGGALALTILRGYPNAIALFVTLLWMMIVAPLAKIVAIAKRRESVHVPIAVKPGKYEVVVNDLAGALERGGITVTRRRASWVYETPGKILARFSGATVRTLVPTELWRLVGDGFEMTLHPMDLALVGTKRKLAHARAAIVRELTFTEAYQTWSKEAQTFEDRLAKAARHEDDIELIGAALKSFDLEFEEWEILYRILLQVRLRLSPVESDGVDATEEPAPPLRDRVAAAVRVLAGQRNGH